MTDLEKDLGSPRSSSSCAFALLTWMVAVIQLACLGGPIQAQFTPPSNEICACPGEDLTYNCTVEGGAATVWSGSAFTCAMGEIALVHTTGPHETECNGVIGRLLPREGQRYTSELIVSISNDLNGTTVVCTLSSGNTLTTIGNSSIVVRSSPYQEVADVRLTNASANTLTFSWPSVDPNCPSISYEMTTPGCGTCSIATNTTTATCTGLQLPSMCIFSVQSVICGFTGMPSNTVTVAVRAPDPPQVDVIPVYSADTNRLSQFRIFITRATSNTLTDPLFGAVAEYTTSYSGGVQRNASCMDDQCVYEVRGPFQDCTTSSSSTTSVTVSASNVFGQGEATSPQTFGCTNEFVLVKYVATSSVITCTFLNTMDTSVKSCTALYGECGQELVQRVEQNSTRASITLQLGPGENLECYTVTASNDTFTVRVDSRLSTPQGSNSIVVIAVVVPIATILMFVIIAMAVVLTYVLREKPELRGDALNKSNTVGAVSKLAPIGSTKSNRVDQDFRGGATITSK